MRRFFIFLFCAAFLTAACDREFPVGTPDDAPDGAYVYTAFDSTGAVVVTGWLTLVFTDSINITGEWHLQQVYEPYELGPQVGDGLLVGGIDNSHLWVNFNPQMADNNVILFGRLENDDYKGDWTWITFIGPTTGGAFSAIKQ